MSCECHALFLSDICHDISSCRISTGAVKDSIVGAELIGLYLLYILIRRRAYTYCTLFGIDRARSSNYVHVLSCISHQLCGSHHIDASNEQGAQNRERAVAHWLSRYREGALGKLTLDEMEEES